MQHFKDNIVFNKMTTKTPDPEPDLSELIKRACAGDRDAFGRIINLYRRRIMGYCYRMLGAGAEDAAQEIFIKLYLALDRFDPSRPVSPFLFRIAHNHCLDILKKKHIKTSSIKGNEGEGQEISLADEGPGPEELVQKAQMRDAVSSALGAIPVMYRSPLIMWHVEGISYEEIAEILEAPVGTIKARIHRGRNLLQQKLTDFVNTNGG